MEAIQAVNRELLSHMETLGLGDAFLAMAPFIKLYSTYANNFANAQAALQVKIYLSAISSEKYQKENLQIQLHVLDGYIIISSWQ